MTATCKSCEAPILWVTTARGRMPLDAAPSDRGNVRLLEGGQALVLAPTEARTRRAAGARLYLSHFATCAHAAKHRKPPTPPVTLPGFET